MFIFNLGIRQLRNQLVLILSILAIFSSILAVIPVVQIYNRQLEQQYDLRLAQGMSSASQNITEYRNRQIDRTRNTTQQPSLLQAISEQDEEAIRNTLGNLQEANKYDLVAFCDAHDNQTIVLPSASVYPACQMHDRYSYSIITNAGRPEVWLLTSQVIKVKGEECGQLISGMKIDNGFFTDLYKQTGLQYSLLLSGQMVAGTLDSETWSKYAHHHENEAAHEFFIDRHTFQNGENQYYASYLPLDDSDLAIEAALDNTSMKDTLRQVKFSLATMIFLIICVAAVLAILLARHIQQLSEELHDPA